MARRVLAAILRLDDHWLGDAIGVASLFMSGWIVAVALHALGLE
jgi:hypothetical protein